MDEYRGNVVVIGGGTGTYTASKGLKKFTKPTVIVSMADDGGSTGRLRDSYGVLPPGDIRRNLVALSDSDGLLREVFEYRFHENGSLYGRKYGDLLLNALTDIISNKRGLTEQKARGQAEERVATLFNPEHYGKVIVRRLMGYEFSKEDNITGHSFGNLTLTALDKITKSYVTAIEIASEILNVKGTVLPVTTDNTRLVAVTYNPQTGKHGLLQGETHIDVPEHDLGERIEQIYLIPKASIHYRAEQAIIDGDLIVIGPGDLWSSVLPNTIVEGVPEALKEAREHGAKIVYVCNLVTEAGETNGFTAADHVEKVIRHIGEGVLTHTMCNNRVVSESLLRKYEEDGRFPVEVDGEKIKGFDIEFIGEDFIGDEETEAQLLRHDPDKIARRLISLVK